MTPQEAHSLAVRLTQIWVPEHPAVVPQWVLNEGRFHFSCEVGSQVFVSFSAPQAPRAVLSQGECNLYCWQGKFEPVYGDPFSAEDELEPLARFTEEWMPLFRRNCYLSGCEVECSAHEQLEWANWLQQRATLGLERRLLMA